MSEGESRNDPLFSTPKARDFFRELVDDVVNDRGFETSEASEIYVVSLLTDAAHSPSAIQKTEQPFGVRLATAMNASGGERFERLRRLGDDVLFVSGFFSEHLETRGLPPDYVAAVGQSAYGGAASMLRAHVKGPQVFDELSDKFAMFVELLRHVADSLSTVALKDEADVLGLYERWQRSRSHVLAKALLELGLIPLPNSPSGDSN